MARLKLSFADPEQAARFPRHGWARNTEGIKLLWLPIQRPMQIAHTIRHDKGVVEHKVPGSGKDVYAFSQIAQKLGMALRELHNLERRGRDIPLSTDTESVAFGFEVGEKVPLYMDLAFIYLRRLADFMTMAIRPVLFESIRSAPQTFKGLQALVNNQTKINALKPICNSDLLQQALNDHSAWFDSLTAKTGGGKGIRDAMEHRVSYVTAIRQHGHGPPQVRAFLQSSAGDVDVHVNLMSTLREIVADLCDLWTGLHASVGWPNEYGEGGTGGGLLYLSGNDEDITGFWPEI